MGKFYITTAIPYVNAKPHVGHALEFVQADCIARYHKLLGDTVCFLSGSDENALKNVQAAEKAGKPVQQFIDDNAILFENLAKALQVEFTVFQKGSNTDTHFRSSQTLWNLCNKNGDIYQKTYSGLYCVGCETFYTRDELNENGECFEHPGKKLETVSETNYFFRLSRYQEALKELITSDTLKIYPDTRKNEVLSFLKQPLQDISISRSNERAKNWGVPVPNDPTQRMYVWFDALNIYQSGIGFGWDDKMYQTWWPADIHVIGKGIIRFHAVYWPAFLLSAKLALPQSLFVHGYFTVDGQKMSKTLGNVVDPMEMIQTYGSDAVRYYFLREIPSFSDGDFSQRRFIELYNADLANGLGNLVSRTAKLIEKNNLLIEHLKSEKPNLLWQQVSLHIQRGAFHEAIQQIWESIALLDKYINNKQPWKKTGDELRDILTTIVQGNESLHSIRDIAESLRPFLPNTAQKILHQFSQRQTITQPALFPRIRTEKEVQ